MPRPARTARAVAVAALALALGACGTPPWEDPSLGGTAPEPTTAARPTPTTSKATAKAAPTPSVRPRPAAQTSRVPEVVDDLASGSAQRVLRAGPAQVRVKYWSTLPLDEWTDGSTKPLTASLTAKGAPASLASTQVRVDRLTSAGWQPVDRRQVTSPALRADADIASPASSMITAMVGDVGADSHAVRLTFVYQVLVGRGTPSSYSVADQVVVSLSPDPSRARAE